MKTLRPLLFVVATALAVTFVLQNEWLWDRHDIRFGLFNIQLVTSSPIALWQLLLVGFLLGYLLAWLVGRATYFSLKSRLRRNQKHTSELEEQVESLRADLASARSAANAAPSVGEKASPAEPESLGSDDPAARAPVDSDESR